MRVPSETPRGGIDLPRPGLYVHVPFCSSICNYCNFNRGLLDSSLKSAFVDAVLAEIRRAATEYNLGARPDTLYFGGGTPSLLTPSDIAAIVEESRRSLRLRGGAEITLEANPETVDRCLAEQFRAAGVNRLSFGVQSFRDEELGRLARMHSAQRARHAIAEAREARFDNISIDLMMWLPEQSTAEWLVSIEEAIRVAPDHISLYILEVYPHLPLKEEIDRHGWQQQPDETAADMYESAMVMLEEAGYEQYEISNGSRAGRRSRHNLKYWTDGQWLGFGPGAHSTWQGSRWRNLSGTADYVRSVACGASVKVDVRQLSAEERLGDALFTGLRLADGIDVESLTRRYGVDVLLRFGERLAPFYDAGILSIEDGRMRLTRKGMLLANEVMLVFV